MKTLFLILAFMIVPAAAQTAVEKDIEATTKDGRVVILKADGTWAFKEKPVLKTLGVTAAGFAALKSGMEYEDVVVIVGGPGELLSENEIGGVKTQIFQWKGKGSIGANMNAMFQGGKMITKSQFGLK